MTDYTDDRVLAAALVDLGILLPNGNGRFRIEGYTWEELNDELAVHDWRVAGAVMEKCGGVYIHSEPHIDGWFAYVETDCAVKLPVDYDKTQNESLPRAIIWAGVRALTG